MHTHHGLTWFVCNWRECIFEHIRGRIIPACSKKKFLEVKTVSVSLKNTKQDISVFSIMQMSNVDFAALFVF